MECPLDPARLGNHLDRLYRAAWALCGSREDAEDLVQETRTLRSADTRRFERVSERIGGGLRVCARASRQFWIGAVFPDLGNT